MGRLARDWDECMLIGMIAGHEATHMGHDLNVIHLLSAALYRLNDADYELAGELGLSFTDVRRWAVAHLPLCTHYFSRRYEGRLDWDYSIKLEIDKLGQLVQQSVSQVSRPVKPATAKGHHEGGSFTVRHRVPDPTHEAAVDSIYELMRPLRPINDVSTLDTCSIILRAILPLPEVQQCLLDIGVSVDRLRDKLGG